MSGEDGETQAAMSADGEGWLLFVLRLDGKGGARPLPAEELTAAWSGDPGTLWVHLRRDAPEAQAWLREHSGLDEVQCDQLLAEETRPGAEAVDGRLQANLRGVNLNPGAEPEDMVSLRASVAETRVVTLRQKRLMAVYDVKATLEQGRGPRTAMGIFHTLAGRLAERVHTVIAALDEEVDTIEEMLAGDDAVDGIGAYRRRLSDVRRRVAALRRFIAPQREALANAAECGLGWLKEPMRRRLRNVRERVGRLLDDLDALRERAAVSHEEVVALQGERMTRTMYALAVVAGIFLPLGFVTGLLGINVGGMPGVESELAFWIVCALLVVLGGAVWTFFRRKGWM